MAAIVKKPPATGRETPTGTPSRPGPRATTPSSVAAAAAAATNLSRNRSLRTGTPSSARAAASQRRESLLGNSITSASVNGNNGADVEREEAIRAETVALLDDLNDRLSKAEKASETHKRQTEVLQSKLDESLKEQAKLEEKVHENEEQIEWLTNEKREGARQMREMESIYEAERSAMMKEKDEMANREEEMQAVIQRLKDSLSQRNHDEDRQTRQAVSSSPSIDSGSFAPPSSIQRSDSRNNSKLVLQKDKMIESLRLELAEAQIKLVETENQGGGRLQEVERLLMEARMANARLMEDNESYQLLLQERTLKGDFGASDFSYMAASSNQDALAALEGRSSGTSLADELSEAAVNDHPQESSSNPEAQRHLETELKTVKDQNKALTLYINKIIERLLQHQEFEHILDQSNDFKDGGAPNTNKELPPPPGGARQAAGFSLLQRAKSMATKPKQRPMSVMPAAGDISTHTNPDTAPSIPIGMNRSASTRRGRPMSEQYTGGAASVVNAMYRGSADGPLSPTLRSSQTFNFLPQGAGNRASSGGGSSYTASNNGGGGGAPSSSGNFPGMKSETSSTSGESIHNGANGHGGGGERDAPSPPRSYHEKNTTFAGNKPRPLRLVQENSEANAQANANKRQSWIGWASAAFVKKEDGTGGPGDPIRE
ncbi:hypothetical protein B0T17DRAFT_484161 [Bombardia bombarda]|uniref:Uncharacterized protein n=1 Tax=Bombardia bombarda TaxID=252184 RepID=A0AA39XL59_9PEZI|nr:hypothetical protein B0T17DRAFT_484161 [Bombardia bombarda]